MAAALDPLESVQQQLVEARQDVGFRQQRVGRHGKRFHMLKFRSMPVDTEKAGVQWGGSAAKATTQFGQFIRKELKTWAKVAAAIKASGGDK